LTVVCRLSVATNLPLPIHINHKKCSLEQNDISRYVPPFGKGSKICKAAHSSQKNTVNPLPVSAKDPAKDPGE
jgi:hypothetical protein